MKRIRNLLLPLALSIGLVATAAAPAHAYTYYDTYKARWEGDVQGQVHNGTGWLTINGNPWKNGNATVRQCIEQWFDQRLHSGHRAPDVFVQCRYGDYYASNLMVRHQNPGSPYAGNPVDLGYYHATDMVVCVVTPPNFTRNSGNCSGDFGPQLLNVGSYSGRDYNSLRNEWNANKPQYVLGNIETAWANETLWSGDQIISPNGQYSAVMQWDGNFVIYNGGGTPVWSTGTYSPGARAVMQGDGNFVLYTPNNQPIWATSWRTGSCCVGGSRLVMQDDGNIVLYTPWNSAVWHRY